MPTVNKIQRPWIKPSTPQSEKKTDPFYHSPSWRKVRIFHIKLKPLCEYCDLFGIKHFGNFCDHEKPRRLFPELELVDSNLKTSCQVAHDIKRNCEKRMVSREQQAEIMKEFLDLLEKHYRNTR